MTDFDQKCLTLSASFNSTRDRICQLIEVANQSQTKGTLQQALVFNKLIYALIIGTQREIKLLYNDEFNQMFITMDQYLDEVETRITTIYYAIRRFDSSCHKSTTGDSLTRNRRLSADSTTVHLIYTCDHVRMYNINPSGGVSTTIGNNILRILCLLSNPDKSKWQTTFFLQIIDQSLVSASKSNADVGNVSDDGIAKSTSPFEDINFDRPWIYPLVSGTSPYHFEDSVFVIPDMYTANAENTVQVNGTVAIVVPGDSEVVLREILDAIFGDVNDVPVEPIWAMSALSGENDACIERQPLPQTHLQQPMPCSLKITDAIGKYLRTQSALSDDRTRGGARPTSGATNVHSSDEFESECKALDIPSSLLTGMKLAKSSTGVAASMTEYVADSVRDATFALGGFLVPRVRRSGSHLLSQSMGYSDAEADEKISGAMNAAADVANGFGSVCAALEQSANVLKTSLRDSTVDIVERKYGPSAGELAADTIDTVGNVIQIGQNVRMFAAMTR